MTVAAAVVVATLAVDLVVCLMAGDRSRKSSNKSSRRRNAGSARCMYKAVECRIGMAETVSFWPQNVNH